VCRLRGSETGYVERRNLGIEWRWAEGQYDRLPALAADLVAQQVAVIVASGGSGAASSFALLVLEAVPRAMPVASTPPVESPTAENPIQRCAPNTPFTWSLGGNFYVVNNGRSNAQGFLADYDYDATASTPVIAVAGDSYIESLRVPFAQTLNGRLQAAMGDRGRAYAFAQSGSPLSQYVAYAQHACSVYHPERLVVNVVGNDFDESVYDHRRRDAARSRVAGRPRWSDAAYVTATRARSLECHLLALLMR
jgi:hypothetical protein